MSRSCVPCLTVPKRQAIQRVDIPIIMGVTLVSACAIVIGNLLADLVAPFRALALLRPIKGWLVCSQYFYAAGEGEIERQI